MNPLAPDKPTPVFTPPPSDAEMGKPRPVFTPPPTEAGASMALKDLPLGQLKQWLTPFFMPGAGAGALDAQGWSDLTGIMSFAYASADGPTGVITISADLTASIPVGARVRYTQTTVKYGIVTAIGATTVTVYGGTDYTTANAVITAFGYSLAKAPVGFPLSPAKWTETLKDTSARSQATPVAGTWYNVGSLTLSIPTGAWDVTFQGCMAVDNGGTAGDVYATLSTANTTESNTSMTSLGQTTVGGAPGDFPFMRRDTIVVSSKTPVYANLQTSGASGSISLRGGNSPTMIVARCAYL